MGQFRQQPGGAAWERRIGAGGLAERRRREGVRPVAQQPLVGEALQHRGHIAADQIGGRGIGLGQIGDDVGDASASRRRV